MKQTARIISTYTADVSGVPSALFELGGMVIMHDASGCNSTYNTHDEPRWYDFDSMVYISGLTEMEAIMGDDEKLIGDIVSAASELHPEFIAIAGSPIPMMIGTDFKAVASVIEKRTGIKTFGIDTNGMHTYISGASKAFCALFDGLCTEKKEKSDSLCVNILGVTPLDFSVNGSVESMKNALIKRGVNVNSCWAMGDTLDSIKNATRASVNLVVSLCGMELARKMQEKFGIPYVVARPCGEMLTDRICDDIKLSAQDGENRFTCIDDADNSNADIVIIGEGIYAKSLSAALRLEKGVSARIICATENCSVKFGTGDATARDEEELSELLCNARVVIADPLYQPILPSGARLLPLPHEAFSGRIFRSDIPDTTESIEIIASQL